MHDRSGSPIRGRLRITIWSASVCSSGCQISWGSSIRELGISGSGPRGGCPVCCWGRSSLSSGGARCMYVVGSSGVSCVGESFVASSGRLASWGLGGPVICWSTCMVWAVCCAGVRSEDVVTAWEDVIETRSEAPVVSGGNLCSVRGGICASAGGWVGGGRGRVGGENCSRRWVYGRALH